MAIDPVDRHSEQRYHDLFEHLPICILVVDPNLTPMTILEANRRAELVYGYAAGELVGMPAAELVPEPARQEILTLVRRAQNGETITAETSNRRRDGTHFPVRVIGVPDPAPNGQIIFAVEDITAERQRRGEAEAIDAERMRIAQEIHDGVAQSLAGLRFKSALWQHLAEGAPASMRAALDEMQAVLNTAIADLRRAIFALRPVDLDALGFFAALALLVDDFGDQNGLAAGLDVSGPQAALPAWYELPLYRIIQESLNNIRQHAGATSVQVCFAVTAAGAVAVAVHDNGRGFDLTQAGASADARHVGLHQMRERVWDLNGTLDIRSSPSQGTELLINLPPIAEEANHGADQNPGCR